MKVIIGGSAAFIVSFIVWYLLGLANAWIYALLSAAVIMYILGSTRRT